MISVNYRHVTARALCILLPILVLQGTGFTDTLSATMEQQPLQRDSLIRPATQTPAPDTPPRNEPSLTGSADTLPALSATTTDSTMVSTTARLQPAPPDSAVMDTTKLLNGYSLGGEFGWSLGSFELMNYWEQALPDSLGSFLLSASSYALSADSGSSELLRFSDTALLVYTVREKPSIYTMSFPVALSLISLTDTRRLSFSIRGSWMRKVYTSAISFRNDSTSNKVDYQQSINIYSLFFSVTHGTPIPPEYFSVEGIERCYFTSGIDFSPLINATIATKAASPANSDRLSAVRKQCESPRKSLFGGSAAVRFGISMLKRINKSKATDVSASLSIQGYGYFFENGKRVLTHDINPDAGKKNRPLFWISNRFEIAITLLGQKSQLVED